MAKQSAGLLLYRRTDVSIEVLLGHPGGPFWAKKDAGSWSIPKGEFTEGEEPLAAARREFEEEVGIEPPKDGILDLGAAKQSSGKTVYVYAVEGNIDTKHVKSNTFEMEWPPKSGKKQVFPEIDKAEWFALPHAAQKLVKGQVPFAERLAELLGVDFVQLSVEKEQTSLF